MTPEEVAAVAAVTIALEQQRAEALAAAEPEIAEHLSLWVEASRRAAQRAQLQRGPWRLSGRLGRRARI
jgi:hypothetical protein